MHFLAFQRHGKLRHFRLDLLRIKATATRIQEGKAEGGLTRTYYKASVSQDCSSITLSECRTHSLHTDVRPSFNREWCATVYASQHLKV
jgi:hypothetical protein